MERIPLSWIGTKPPRVPVRIRREHGCWTLCMWHRDGYGEATSFSLLWVLRCAWRWYREPRGGAR